jgi:hypothetical protein
MICEIKGLCPECLEETFVLVHNEKIITQCTHCKATPFEFNRIEGVVYVVKNQNQSGVKIGLTRKTVEQRCKSLSSSGVAGTFEPIAIFPTDNPKKHEKIVHEKLSRYRLDKEHFNLGTVEASLRVYRALNKRIEPIFYDDGIKETFQLELEKAKIEMKLRLKGKSSGE